MRKSKVYLETTIVSYLAAWSSRDLITAANQQTTHDWWRIHRLKFELFVSKLVLQEAKAGDQDAARRRLQILERIPQLDVTNQSEVFAVELMKQLHMTDKAKIDALHIAVAVIHGMDYMMTWNYTHIANATLRHRIEAVCRNQGYEPPIICTPQELIEV